jgi:hypothetical protein
MTCHGFHHQTGMNGILIAGLVIVNPEKLTP